MLAERLQRNELTLVNDRQDISNAVNYMNTNRLKVTPRYKELRDFLRNYNQNYFQGNWPNLSSKSKIIENKISTTLRFINQKMDNVLKISR